MVYNVNISQKKNNKEEGSTQKQKQIFKMSQRPKKKIYIYK